jgi:hypothetical protein
VYDTTEMGESKSNKTGKLISPFRLKNNNNQIIMTHWKDNCLIEQIFSNLNSTESPEISQSLANTIEAGFLE